MESSGVVFTIDKKILESKSELEAVYFSKPRLVAYYGEDCNVAESAKRICYFKKPKSQDYPINLNTPSSNELNFTAAEDLQRELKYAMAPMFKKNVENLKKIKIFTSQWCLINVMYYYYFKIRTQQTIRVSRYNSELYILFGNDDYYSACKANKNWQKLSRRSNELRNHVFTESLYYDPNINKPDRSPLYGVHQSSFGEFEIIYSAFLYGIQAEEEFNDFDDLEALSSCRWVITKALTDCDEDVPLDYLFLWLRAYLTNATDVYIAYTNSDGIVNEPVVHKHISEIPKENKADWKPSICTGFLYKFLQEVNTLMSNHNVNSLNTVYEFCINTDNTVTYKIFKDKPEKVILTPEYIEYCKKQASN